MSQHHYDFIMAGGGAAGLSLAYNLTHSPLRDKRILIVDLDQKQNNDRTWCFWTADEPPYPEIISRSWPAFNFHGEGFESRLELSPYAYYMIRGIDFYRHTRSVLDALPNVDFLTATVDEVRDGHDRAEVRVGDNVYTADWVFDSLFLPGEFRPDRVNYHYIWQHFTGWTIRTAEPVFDPDAATLFDFRVPQHGVMRFMYILPTSATEALVEYTLFSADLLPDEEYVSELQRYITGILGVHHYDIIEEESGKIPMSDQPFPRRGGNRIMYTGTKGGRVKASTGFAFFRTQRDSKAIVESLLTRGHPFHGNNPPARYRLFDSMLLQILYRHGELAKTVFTRLFEKNPVTRILRFLDEADGWGENLKLMATVPWWPFIRAWIKLKIFRKI
ncbi:MAG: Lycopene cyclase [Spirochaetes bacterium]|jgi:lycopene beta-cyclase|nr:Lycopene cyclase [Spirochaetota bacterium]